MNGGSTEEEYFCSKTQRRNEMSHEDTSQKHTSIKGEVGKSGVRNSTKNHANESPS